MRKFRKQDGFTLAEVLLVTFIIAILAAITLPNLTGAAEAAKVHSFAGTLANLQTASDQFFIKTSVYPTYSGATVANQPVTGSAAAQLTTAAQDLRGTALLPGYIRMAPDAVAADFALDGTQGTTVYYGITASGRVFATQVAPTAGQWTSGTIAVYTQDSVQAVTAGGRPGSVQLSTIW